MVSYVFFEVIGFVISILMALLVIIFATKLSEENNYVFIASSILMFKQFVNACALLIKVILTFVLINSPPTHIHTITGKIIYLSKISQTRLNLSNKILQQFDYFNIYYFIALVIYCICIFALYYTLFLKKYYKKKIWYLFAPDVDVYMVLVIGLPLLLNYLLHIVNIHIHNKYFEIFIATLIMIILIPKNVYKAKLQIKQKKLGHNTIQVFALLVAYITSLIIAIFNLGVTYDLDCLAFIFLIFAIAEIGIQIIKIKTQLKVKLYEQQVFDFEVLNKSQNKMVPINKLVKGQCYVLKKNQLVPLKSKLITASNYFSPLNINGENKFIHEQEGAVIEASLVNLSAYCEFEALEDFKSSSYHNLKQSLKKLKVEKTRLHKSGQKFVKIIIYLVAISAIIDFGIWTIVFHNFATAINTMISIILLTCPCGIGTGLPTLFHLYVLKNLKNNVFIKNINVIEDIKECKVIAFDKTGTLTSLEFTLEKGLNFNLYEQIIYSLELNAIHPLSSSITSQIKSKGLVVKDFKEHELLGISGSIENNQYYLGNKNFVKQVLPQTRVTNEQYYLFDNDKILTTFNLDNKLKPTALELNRSLQSNYTTIIISGDGNKNVEKVAKKLKIKHFFANLSTNKKAKLISTINEKEKIMYVGDGQNDSLGMVNAHVGISFARGSVLTNKYSDIILLDENIGNLNSLILFSKWTAKILNTIIILTLIYNIIFILLSSFNIISMGLAPLGEIITTIIILIFVSFVMVFKWQKN